MTKIAEELKVEITGKIKDYEEWDVNELMNSLNSYGKSE